MIATLTIVASLFLAVNQEPCFDSGACNSSRWVLTYEGYEVWVMGDMSLDACVVVRDSLNMEQGASQPQYECEEQLIYRQDL